jgi:hypothetical protein
MNDNAAVTSVDTWNKAAGAWICSLTCIKCRG